MLDRLGIACACACAVLAGIGAAPAVASTLETFERRLAAAGKKTRTLSGRFVQRKRLRLFKTEVVTKGKLFYQRPDRLRWQTLAPDASTLMVAGKRAELRLPGERARVIDLKKNRTVAALVDQLLIWLGARTGQSLSRWYHLTIKEERGYRLSLTPRSTAHTLRKRISKVHVVFDRTMLLESIKIHHVGGDVSHIKFSGIQRNAELPPKPSARARKPALTRYLFFKGCELDKKEVAATISPRSREKNTTISIT